jgi:O-glycosyl hydrolase
MKNYFYLCSFFLNLLVFVNRAEAQSIEIDPGSKFQTIEGWGSSLSWWANIVGGWPADELTELYAEITSPDELNMNIFKYNIPGGDNHEQHSPSDYYWFNTFYGYPTHFRWDSGDITSYKPSAGAPYDWSANANQRNVLLGLTALRDDEILEAISYSPPYWMTVSGCSGGNGGGLVPGQPTAVLDNISSARIPEYADFLTDIVKHYHDNLGITFSYISPLNEPTTDYWTYGGGQEGCKVSTPLQMELIRSVYSNIQSKGMGSYTAVSAADDTNIDQTFGKLKAYGSAGDILPKLGRIATHSYSGTQRSGVADIVAANNLNVWQTEVGGEDPGYLGMSEKIILDLKKMYATAWINWQIVSTDPRWGLYTFDSNGLAGLNSRTLTKAKSYYGHKQFSKYIKRGYQIIRSTDDSSLAALSPDNSELVIIVINKNNGATDKVIDLTRFASTATSTGEVVRTSPNENTAIIANLPVVNGVLSYTAPSQSITTIVLPVSVATTSAASVPDGVYRLKAKHSNKFMSVNGFSSDNAATISQWEGGLADNFLFEIEKIGFDYTIKPVYNDKYLSIDQDSRSNGAAIIQYDDIGVDNQRFFILPDDEDGYFKIVSKHSYLYLAVANESSENGAQVVQWEDLDADNFKWELIDASLPFTPSVDPTLPDGLYKIRAKHSGKLMSVNSFSRSSGVPIQQWTDNDADNMKFVVEKTDNWYTIKPRFDELSLAIENSSLSWGGVLIQATPDGSESQQFYIVDDNNGAYKIINKGSELAIAVEGSSTADGAAIVQWQDLNADNFRWEFIPVSEPSPLPSGDYFVKAVHSDKFMSVAGFSTTNGAVIEQYEFVNQDNLRFSLTQDIAGYYKFRPVYTDKVVTIDGAALDNGTAIVIDTDVDGINQKFEIVPVGNDQYKIVSKYNEDKSFAVAGNSINNGADVVLWGYIAANDNFKWEFTIDDQYNSSALQKEEIKSQDWVGFSQIVAYPNPNEGKFTVTMDVSKVVRLKIFDVFGRLLFDEVTDQSRTDLDLDRQLFPQGVYWLNIYEEAKLIGTKKILIN